MNDQWEVEPKMRTLLDPGERLLWSGQAKSGIHVGLNEAFMIVVGCFWIYLTVDFYQTDEDSAAEFFLLLGLILGLRAVIGLPLYDALVRSRTFYSVTDHRVIIRSGIRKAKVDSIVLGSISSLRVEEHSDGGGTITFNAPQGKKKWWNYLREDEPAPAFLLQSDVQYVAQIIRSAQATAASFAA